MGLNLYVVRQRVPYEGDNVWVVTAKDREEAKTLSIGGSRIAGSDVYIDLISSDSIYQNRQVLWTNT